MSNLTSFYIEILKAGGAILDALAWPIVAAFGLYFFRNEFRSLIGRIRKGGGVEFDPPSRRQESTRGVIDEIHGGDSKPMDSSGAKKETPEAADEGTRPATDPPELPRTPFTREMEAVVSDLRVVNEAKESDRAKILKTLTARAMVILQFEDIERLIWASQLALLFFLNQEGRVATEIARKYFFEKAASENPDFFKGLSFDTYLQFLYKQGVIEATSDGQLILTQKGREYLSWRVEQGKPPKIVG